jgi:Xaa-Pro aminopeptidase
MSDRLTRARAAMERAGLDLLILTNPADIAYLSGFRFTPFEHIAALAVPLEGRLRFLFPGYEEAGVARAVPEETELFMFPEVGSDEEAFAAFVKGLDRHSRVAITRAATSVEHAERLGAGLGNGDGLLDCSALVGHLRAVKDDEEIALIEEASQIGDRAVVRMIDEWLRPGAREADLGGELHRILRLEGADGSAFEPSITSGWRSALPHGPDHSRKAGDKPGQDRVEAGELLIFDFSVIAGGYVADLSRTYVLGDPEPKQQEIFEIVKEAQRAAIDVCVAGSPVSEVDRVAKAIIAEAGYADCSPQKTGHGVGIELHELPFVSTYDDGVLEAGMTFCVEPAIYLSGYGGARVEDVVVVMPEGPPRVLTDRSSQERLELPLT